MKKTILLSIILLITTRLFSQENDQLIVRKHEFGFHSGTSTGLGLSYRYWPQKIGIQFTTIPIKTKDFSFFSLGVTGLYNFYESEKVCFFAYWGNHFIFNRERQYDYSYMDPYSNQSHMVTHKMYNTGFGPGFGFGNRVRFNIMAGYGIYDFFGEFNIWPTIEGGLYFRL